MHIDGHEFAVLDDGRRLTLHQDRGFSTSATHMTADHAERSVLMTVLPDDAEELATITRGSGLLR